MAAPAFAVGAAGGGATLILIGVLLVTGFWNDVRLDAGLGQ